jgi:hypothetical protein
LKEKCLQLVVSKWFKMFASNNNQKRFSCRLQQEGFCAFFVWIEKYLTWFHLWVR